MIFALSFSMANAQQPNDHATPADRALAPAIEAREKDWRNGPVVYQVLVDRFAPSADLERKRHLYPPPKRLRAWGESARRGRYLAREKLWSHEIDFWGGDLASLTSRLDYVQQLGVDVLYLNPISLAYTNHKYDTFDYREVSSEYGTRDDVKRLAAELHRRGMKLVLDGVFNHMGRNSPAFRDAERDPSSRYRDWFVFGPQYPGGARAWWNVQNLPELNLENAALRDELWGTSDSVVRGWLRDGVDGWRLDVAYDLGFTLLAELTRAAHAEKPGSLVVGELPNYPKEWLASVDGVMQFGLRRLLLAMADGSLDAASGGRMVTRLIDDAGIDGLLRSWVYLDNHDTLRQATAVPDARKRRVAQTLQFTLPGAPNLYYGSELGMTGGDDPAMRSPMRWDVVARGHQQLAWTKALVALRKQHRALRVGNYRTLEAKSLYAFERYTDRARESVFVVANPSGRTVKELVLVTDSKAMDGTMLTDLLGQARQGFMIQSAMFEVKVPAHTVLVLTPGAATQDGYDNFKRVR